MRLMGRFCSESSPVRRVVNACPAKIPASRRIVVPEFPASSAFQLLFSPRAPRPVTFTRSFSTFTSAPNALHARQRAVAIHGRRKVAQFAGAFGKPRQHGVAVRDGFVSRRLHAAGDRFGRLYGFFFHAQILPRRLHRTCGSTGAIGRTAPAATLARTSKKPFSTCPAGQFFLWQFALRPLKFFADSMRIMIREKCNVRASHDRTAHY